MLLAFVAPTQNTPFLQYLKAINPSRANLEIQANIPVRGRRTDVHSPSTRPRSQGRRVCFVTSAATLLLIPHRGHHSRTNEHRPDRMDHRVPIPVWAVDRPIVTLVVLEAKESAQWRSVLEAFLFRHPIPLTATQPFTRCPPSSSSCPTPHTTKRLLQPASPCPHRLTRGKSEKKKYATIILRASWPHQHQPAPLGSILWPRKILSVLLPLTSWGQRRILCSRRIISPHRDGPHPTGSPKAAEGWRKATKKGKKCGPAHDGPVGDGWRRVNWCFPLCWPLGFPLHGVDVHGSR